MGAIEWLKEHKLNKLKWEYFVNSDGLKDRRIVSDNSADGLWARFYDLETELPYVCDRDGIKKTRLEDIGYERRNGYNWYTASPNEILALFPEWKKKWAE